MNAGNPIDGVNGGNSRAGNSGAGNPGARR